MTRKPIVVLGTGGNSLDIAESIESLPEWELVGFLDDDPRRRGASVIGYRVLGELPAAREMAGHWFVNGIGSPATFRRKREIVARTGVPRERFATIVHPSATVSSRATLGHGVVILQNATVAVHAALGDHVIVLPSSVVSHDCVVGDYTCLAGGCCLSGGVEVGSDSYVGTNVAIRQGVRIGRGAMLGMGAVLIRDVPAGETWAGTPAKRLDPSAGSTGRGPGAG